MWSCRSGGPLRVMPQACLRHLPRAWDVNRDLTLPAEGVTICEQSSPKEATMTALPLFRRVPSNLVVALTGLRTAAPSVLLAQGSTLEIDHRGQPLRPDSDPRRYRVG